MVFENIEQRMQPGFEPYLLRIIRANVRFTASGFVRMNNVMRQRVANLVTRRGPNGSAARPCVTCHADGPKGHLAKSTHSGP